MNLKNFIRCVLKKNAPIFCNVWNFFSNVKQTLKKVWLNSCRTDLLYYCNRLLIGLNLNFDTVHLDFFLKCKIALIGGIAEARGLKACGGDFM